MNGEMELDRLLREMQPVLDDGTQYVFVSVPRSSVPAHVEHCLALFHETEGTTLIVGETYALKCGLELEQSWAHITLTVFSSLEAVGLTARVATALADAGISINPVAAFFHDHLFVPWGRRHEAMTVLRRLSGSP